MELDISIGAKKLAIPISDPFRLDMESIMGRIDSFLSAQEAVAEGLDIRELLPKLVKGIAGCEGGCPADAKSLVERGYKNFKLAYIEGGILQAQVTSKNGKHISLKMFPDF